MLYIDATRIFLYMMIMLTGNSFSLPRSQANTSEDTTNGYFNSWQCSDEFFHGDQLKNLHYGVNVLLEGIEKLKTDAVIENKTIFYHPINIIVGGYRYTQTNQSFERLRDSSIRFKRIRGHFNKTTEVQLYLSFNSKLTIDVNITRPYSTKLVKSLTFIVERAVFVIRTNINQSFIKSHTPPKLKHFDYNISVKNYEQVDSEPPTDQLIAEIKKLIQSAFIHKFSNETKRNLMTEFFQHYPKILRDAYCTSHNHTSPYIMWYFPSINISSNIWKMKKVKVNQWPNLKYIKIIYLENLTKINLALGNSSIYLRADCNSSTEQQDITNDYEFDQIRVILTVEKERKTWKIKFDGFKPINQSTSNLLDNQVEEILRISMETAICADSKLTINIQNTKTDLIKRDILCS